MGTVCSKYADAKCAECQTGEYINSQITPPKCKPCDVRCKDCSGPQAFQCKACDKPLYLGKLDGKDTGNCVKDCRKYVPPSLSTVTWMLCRTKCMGLNQVGM